MGYNQKTTYCDLAELEKGREGRISGLFGCNSNSNSSLEGQKAKFVDLKLSSFKKDNYSSMEPPPPSPPAGAFAFAFSSSTPPGPGGSSKRGGRAPTSGSSGGGGQVVSCLVDGCKSDLSKCRDYHRRHKVCEMHSKSPRVTISGLEQRFCQQCSRFHSLGEFDEGKRSCRKRLEGHNRRRRKPQPEPPLAVNHPNFLSPNQGGRFLPFSNQQGMSSVLVSSGWSEGVKSESNPTSLYSSSSSSSCYSVVGHRDRRFPFLQGGPDSPLTTTGGGGGPSSSSGHHHNHNPNSISGNDHTQKMFYNNSGLIIDPDPDRDRARALSLLSSSPSPVETPDMGLGRMIHPTARPGGLHFNCMGQFPGHQAQGPLEAQPGSGSSSSLISNMRSSSNNSLCEDVFHDGSSCASASGGHHTLSFSWD